MQWIKELLKARAASNNLSVSIAALTVTHSLCATKDHQEVNEFTLIKSVWFEQNIKMAVSGCPTLPLRDSVKKKSHAIFKTPVIEILTSETAQYYEVSHLKLLLRWSMSSGQCLREETWRATVSEMLTAIFSFIECTKPIISWQHKHRKFSNFGLVWQMASVDSSGICATVRQIFLST